jgi:hypothetical protein
MFSVNARFCQPKSAHGEGKNQRRFNRLARRRRPSTAAGEEVYAVPMSASRIQELLERREAIAREIARHPRPITGCDVHFNRLLEERAALSEEIDRLEELQAARTKPTISSP